MALYDDLLVLHKFHVLQKLLQLLPVLLVI